MTVFNNVNANIGAHNARRFMDINSAKQSRANAQLASGSLTSDPAENAPGSALGSMLATNIAAEVQASANVTQASAMLGLAAGTQELVVELLTTMKQRTTQANSDTISDAARAMLDKEYQNLLAQIDVAAATKWNGVSLFSGGNGTASRMSTLASVGEADIAIATTDIDADLILDGFVAGSVQAVSVVSSGADSADITLSVGGQTFKGNIQFGETGLMRFESTVDSSSAISINVSGSDLSSSSVIEAQLKTLFSIDTLTPIALRSASTDLSSKITSVTAGAATPGKQYGLSYGYDPKQEKAIYKLTDGKTSWVQSYEAKSPVEAAQNLSARTVVFENGMTIVTADDNDETSPLTGYELINVDGGVNVTMNVQIGASTDTMMVLDFHSITTSLLGLSGTSLLTKDKAIDAAAVIDAAMVQINTMKADIGGKKSQLNFQGNALELQRQNETAAKATFTDADIAVSLQDSTQFQALAQMAQNVFANLLQEPGKLSSMVQQALR